MSEPTGPFKVVLSSVEESWNSRLRSEVSRVFQIDDETASNIVSAIPIVVLDGLDARTAGVVRERLRGLVEAGCRVITTDDPADTIPRVNWPEVPEVARVPAEEPRQVASFRDTEPKSLPIASFTCPGCGHMFNVSHVGASAKPGVGAPSGGLPGTGRSAAVAKASPPATNGVAGKKGYSKDSELSELSSVEPTSTSKDSQLSELSTVSSMNSDRGDSEPGARLDGDDWLDPPLTTTKKKDPFGRPERTFEQPTERVAAQKPAPAPPPAKKAPSLLDDPLLAARMFDQPATTNASSAPPPTSEPPVFSSGEPTTLVARPITNRFSRNVVQKEPAAPPPTPQPATPGTGRFGPAPSKPSTARYTAPPPSQPTPTRSFSKPAPIPPPPPSFAAQDSTKSDVKKPDLGGKGSALDEELDVHFSDSSEDNRPALKKAAAAANKDDDDLPAGLLDDAEESSSARQPSVKPGAKKPAAKPAAKPPTLDSDDQDDLLPFDDLESSRGSSSIPAPKAKVTSESSADGSFDGGRIDDLLDGGPPATVSRPGMSGRGGGTRKIEKVAEKPKPPDEDELLVDDEEPAPKKPAKKPLDVSEDDDDADSTLFGDSGEQPTLKGKGPVRPNAKSKLPKESSFADALDLFQSEDENPLGSGEMAGAKPGADDDVPRIKPLDLASDVQFGPGAVSPTKAKKKPQNPFDKPSSSAILEPLDPNEAMAILKTHQKDDDPSLSGSDERPPRRVKEGSGSLEPLDPNEALAILGTPDERGRPGKTPPKKPGRQKNGRTSDASKLVPLSASDEDLGFLEPSKGAKGGAPKATDPFARAKKSPSGDKHGASPGKKRDDPFAKAQKELDSSSSAAHSAPKGLSPAKKSGDAPAKGGKPAPKRSAPVPEGAGECGLVLPRIPTDDKREKAAEIISEIKGIAVEDALKLTERTIIPVLTGVSRDVAEFHREKFERNKISARVTTRAKEK
jgi:hypothetical protein